MFPSINVKETGINLRRIMDKRGYTVKDVQKYLGLASVQSVYHWINGLSMPSVDNLYALSELLRVPMDGIVRGNRASIMPDVTFAIKDMRDRRVYAYYEKLNQRFVA